MVGASPAEVVEAAAAEGAGRTRTMDLPNRTPAMGGAPSTQDDDTRQTDDPEA